MYYFGLVALNWFFNVLRLFDSSALFWSVVTRDFSIFLCIYVYFLLFSTVYIVGSFTSKLPSITICVYTFIYIYINNDMYLLYIYIYIYIYIKIIYKYIYIYIHWGLFHNVMEEYLFTHRAGFFIE